MASPLSPLSPSKQNSRRAHLPTHRSDNFDPSDAEAPLPLFSPRAEGKRMTIYDNDENASPVKQKRSSMHETPPRATDNKDHSRDDENSVEDLPSSPFQDTVVSEHTNAIATHAAHTVDDGDGHIGQEYEETLGDVEIAESQSQSDQAELHNMDVGNDAIHEAQYENDGQANSGSADDSVVVQHEHQEHQEHQEHRQVNHSSPRKVSNMTVENENMSVVYDQQKVTTKASDGDGDNDNYDTGDDTCLSTFSAVPNADMTLFSKLRADSPAKRLRETLSPKKFGRSSHLREFIQQTPGSNSKDDTNGGIPDMAPPAQDSPAGSPTPKRKYPRIDDSMNLLEFTDQSNAPSPAHGAYRQENAAGSPSRRGNRRSPTKKSPPKMDLLDFDIPPAPTPRSVPTITPRELESLKSSFMSQISSLKATLSGRDAEVVSLKDAVADAERRAGEALEEVRNEATRKEALESEQREWERRGKEMESVLRNVKADIVEGERERERLSKKADDAEKGKEQLEGRVVELESQLSAAREAASAAESASLSVSAPDNEQSKISTVDTAKEVQDAVEKVARELHSLYKSKHETKVAALKKSYEARWEKRLREAENKLREAVEEIERLKTEQEATATGATNGPPAGDTTVLRESEELEAQKRVLEARVKGLEQEMLALKRDSEILRSELRSERAEKGELVAVVDEWLAMQQEQHEEPQQQEPQAQLDTQNIPSLEPSTPRQVSREDDGDVAETHGPDGSENAEPAGSSEDGGASSIPGAPGHPPSSNVRPRVAPGTTPKVPRFGMPSGYGRGNAGGEKSISSGIGRIPAPGRSGIMSSIERMGRGGGGGGC